MQGIKIEVISIVIRIAWFFVAVYVLPALMNWLAETSENYRLNAVKEWAARAVMAAEQSYKDYAKTDPHGVKRKKLAKEIIQSACQKFKIALSPDEIDALIESTVLALKGEGQEVD